MGHARYVKINIFSSTLYLFSFSLRSSVHWVLHNSMNNSKIMSQLAAGIAASLFALCVGYHMAWPTASLPKLLASDSDIRITSEQGSWIVSFFLLSGTFGIFIAGSLVDRCGRKLSLLITVLPITSSCILIGLARNYWYFLIARCFAGISFGMTYTIAPMYLGEIAEERIRGALCTIPNVLLNVGVLLTYCIGPWISRTALASLGGVLPLVFGLIFVGMPESPYFLIMKNKPSEAEKSLKCLRGTESVSAELEKIRDSVEFDMKNAATMKDLVLIPGNRKALIIICCLMAAQQFSGISTILAYSSFIFEASGSSIDSNICVIAMGVVQLLSGMLTIFTIDLAGRRLLLFTSACGVILSLIGEALYFYLQSIGTDVSGISWLPVTAMVSYMTFYMLGLGCVPHVVLSEMLPCTVKALAVMIFSITGSVIGTTSTRMYQVIADEYGMHFAFFGFAVITALLSIFIFFTLPETKQRSFRSIQDELHKSNNDSNDCVEESERCLTAN